MKNHLLKISFIFLMPMLLLVGILTVSAVTRANAPAGAHPVQTIHEDSDGSTLVALRLISIPYGIDNMLGLNPDGTVVNVSGHGECPEGGVTFRIMVMVTQNGQQQRALGNTKGNCAGTSSWAANALTPGNHVLVPGPAQVCAKVIIFGSPDGAMVGDWCKSVTLAH